MGEMRSSSKSELPVVPAPWGPVPGAVPILKGPAVVRSDLKIPVVCAKHAVGSLLASNHGRWVSFVIGHPLHAEAVAGDTFTVERGEHIFLAAAYIDRNADSL